MSLEDWRSDVLSTGRWERAPDPAWLEFRGASEGFFVRNSETEQLAFLKPTHMALPEHTPWPAYEKICADLAIDAGLPVPPVLLYRRPDTKDAKEHRVCLSLVLEEEAVTDWPPKWSPTPQERDRALKALRPASGVITFDAWVQNVDRDDIRANCVFLYDPWRAHFLDWGNCLNRQDRWMNAYHGEASVQKMPSLLREALDPERVLECVTIIEGLSDDRIEKTVRRIPPDYLSADRAEVIYQTLLKRRESIRSSVESFLENL